MKPVNLNRRQLALGLSCSLATPGLATAAAAAGPRPNILFFLADDMDYGLFTHMAKTRRLLGERGVEFTNNFVSHSLCGPSRASILRGQFAHNTGIRSNGGAYGGFHKFFNSGLESSTVATWLQGAGYRTALMGKYLNNYPVPRSGPNYVLPGWNTWFVANGGDPYRQYDYSMNLDGNTEYFGNATGEHMNDVLLRQGIEFLKSAASDPPGRPFFLEMAPFLPHGPSMAPGRYLRLFPGLQAPRTPAFNEADVGDKPRWVRALPLLDAAALQRLDTFHRRRRQATQALDDMLESLVATLESTGQLANTVVVFSSDNGFQQGEHRIPGDKRCAYEESIRVPLLMAGPGIPAGRSVAQLAANVDLAPTFAALAGVAPPDFVDGRSLLPLLGGAAPARWRQSLLLESQPAQISGLYQAYRGLRTANGQSFVVYDSGEGEYYDLRTDPYQLLNRYDGMNAALKGALAAQLQALGKAGGAALRRAEEMAAGAP